MVPYRAPKNCIVVYYRLKYRLCLQSAGYKFCILTSFIWLRRKIKNINISLKFIMLTDNTQIFRNCFVIISCHLTKVSSQINKYIIFEPNELSITLSALMLILLDFSHLSRYFSSLFIRSEEFITLSPSTQVESVLSSALRMYFN